MRNYRLVTPFVVVALMLAACSGGDEGSPGEGGSGGGGDGEGALGGTVSILAVYADAEQESFLAMIQPWADENGVEIEYSSTRDINAQLTTQIAGGNPPDIAGLPGPGPMAQFARDGDLVPLTDVIDMDTYSSQYDQGWITAGTVDDELVGIFTKVSVKGLIFYNPAQFEAAGYTVPEDYDGLTALVDQIAADGTPSWGIGLESGAASGWPGTDWIEDFVLRQSGPDVYDQWVAGELPWTSPEITAAFEAFGAWASSDEFVAGGAQQVINTPFGNGGDCLFSEPPECYLHHQASFITGFFEDNFPDVAVAGETYDFFPMPGIEFDGVTTAGDLFGMFNDTPQARSLMQYLTTPEAQQIWVERGGAISPSKEVPVDAYPDETSRRFAEIIQGAETTRFDASDLMPSAMNEAFFGAVLDYVQNPENLDSVLGELDAVQADAYSQ
jgi:alpha-glucoside transport system substrate-binding protein